MNFRDLLNTLSPRLDETHKTHKITVYHGSNKKFNKIEPSYMLMDGSNAQEGVGIYFGDYSTAETYGDYIMSVQLDTNNFVDSYSLIGDNIKTRDLTKLCKDMYKANPEEFFYKVSDWIPIQEIEDVTDSVISEFASTQTDEMIRYFTADFAMTFGIDVFIKSWNKHIKYVHGTFNKQLGFYAVMNTNYKLEAIDD